MDGGGLKGFVAVKVLQLIESVINQPLTKKFNLLAGTSSGGLIVSALSVEDTDGVPLYNLQYIEEIFLDVANDLFKKGSFNLSGGYSQILNTILLNTFGKKVLTDTVVPLLVPAYDVKANTSVIFKTRSAVNNSSKNILLMDVCRATSAVPGVFPVVPIEYDNKMMNCLDGGYYFKDPSIAAVTELVKHKQHYDADDLIEEDIVLLSVSTGNFGHSSKHWSTNIQDVFPVQQAALTHLKKQSFEFDLTKISYLRIDLNLGNDPISLKNLFLTMDKLEIILADAKLSEAIVNHLN